MTVREGQGDRRERQGSFGVGADLYSGGDTLKGVPMEQWVRIGEVWIVDLYVQVHYQGRARLRVSWETFK